MKEKKNQVHYQLDKEIAALVKDLEHPYLLKDATIECGFSDFLNNKMLVIAAIRVGIPYALFEIIQFRTPFSEKDWADFLDISTKSLQRYKAAAKHRFKPIHSEKILEMAEVTEAGLEVFGSHEKLKLWLHTPNYALGRFKPLELLKDSYGKELVLSELTRVSHGILV